MIRIVFFLNPFVLLDMAVKTCRDLATLINVQVFELVNLSICGAVQGKQTHSTVPLSCTKDLPPRLSGSQPYLYIPVFNSAEISPLEQISTTVHKGSDTLPKLPLYKGTLALKAYSPSFSSTGALAIH
jgi:hypothetical protein